MNTLLHGNDWTGQDVSGWFCSEKLRGWRLVWTGREYLTRTGIALDVPDEWIDGMPDCPLDGELWAGRHPHEGPVKSAVANGDWHKLTFHPFDVPIEGMTTEAAQDCIARLRLPPHVRPVAVRRVNSTAEALTIMREIVECGGEGVMLRKPGSAYVPFRCNELLKVKP